jgi:hypothetical protein
MAMIAVVRDRQKDAGHVEIISPDLFDALHCYRTSRDKYGNDLWHLNVREYTGR